MPSAIDVFVNSGRPSNSCMGVRIATSSTGGRIEAPWTLAGTARHVEGRIVYDMRLEFAAQDGPKSISFAGFWEKTADKTSKAFAGGLDRACASTGPEPMFSSRKPSRRHRTRYFR